MGKSKLANAICCPILLRSYLIFYSIFLLSRALLHISALGECVFAFVFLCLPNELSIDCQIIKQKRSVGKASRGGFLSLENENCLLCRQQHFATVCWQDPWGGAGIKSNHFSYKTMRNIIQHASPTKRFRRTHNRNQRLNQFLISDTRYFALCVTNNRGCHAPQWSASGEALIYKIGYIRGICICRSLALPCPKLVTIKSRRNFIFEVREEYGKTQELPNFSGCRNYRQIVKSIARHGRHNTGFVLLDKGRSKVLWQTLLSRKLFAHNFWHPFGGSEWCWCFEAYQGTIIKG